LAKKLQRKKLNDQYKALQEQNKTYILCDNYYPEMGYSKQQSQAATIGTNSYINSSALRWRQGHQTFNFNSGYFPKSTFTKMKHVSINRNVVGQLA